MWKCTTIDIYPWFYVNLIYRSNWSLGIMSLWQTGSDVLIWITLYHGFSWSMTSSIPSTHYLDIADWFYYAHKWCRIRDRPSYFRREGLCLFFFKLSVTKSYWRKQKCNNLSRDVPRRSFGKMSRQNYPNLEQYPGSVKIKWSVPNLDIADIFYNVNT